MRRILLGLILLALLLIPLHRLARISVAEEPAEPRWQLNATDVVDGPLQGEGDDRYEPEPDSPPGIPQPDPGEIVFGDPSTDKNRQLVGTPGAQASLTITGRCGDQMNPQWWPGTDDGPTSIKGEFSKSYAADLVLHGPEDATATPWIRNKIRMFVWTYTSYAPEAKIDLKCKTKDMFGGEHKIALEREYKGAETAPPGGIGPWGKAWRHEVWNDWTQDLPEEGYPGGNTGPEDRKNVRDTTVESDDVHSETSLPLASYRELTAEGEPKYGASAFRTYHYSYGTAYKDHNPYHVITRGWGHPDVSDAFWAETEQYPLVYEFESGLLLFGKIESPPNDQSDYYDAGPHDTSFGLDLWEKLDGSPPLRFAVAISTKSTSVLHAHNRVRPWQGFAIDPRKYDTLIELSENIENQVQGFYLIVLDPGLLEPDDPLPPGQYDPAPRRPNWVPALAAFDPQGSGVSSPVPGTTATCFAQSSSCRGLGQETGSTPGCVVVELDHPVASDLCFELSTIPDSMVTFAGSELIISANQVRGAVMFEGDTEGPFHIDVTLLDDYGQPTSLVLALNEENVSIQDIDDPIISYAWQGPRVATTFGTIGPLVVHRTGFSDYGTSSTVIALSAVDPDGVLGSPLPSTVAIPAGESHVGVPVALSGQAGAVEITLGYDTQTVRTSFEVHQQELSAPASVTIPVGGEVPLFVATKLADAYDRTILVTTSSTSVVTAEHDTLELTEGAPRATLTLAAGTEGTCSIDLESADLAPATVACTVVGRHLTLSSSQVTLHLEHAEDGDLVALTPPNGVEVGSITVPTSAEPYISATVEDSRRVWLQIRDAAPYPASVTIEVVWSGDTATQGFPLQVYSELGADSILEFSQCVPSAD